VDERHFKLPSPRPPDRARTYILIRVLHPRRVRCKRAGLDRERPAQRHVVAPCHRRFVFPAFPTVRSDETTDSASHSDAGEPISSVEDIHDVPGQGLCADRAVQYDAVRGSKGLLYAEWVGQLVEPELYPGLWIISAGVKRMPLETMLVFFLSLSRKKKDRLGTVHNAEMYSNLNCTMSMIELCFFHCNGSAHVAL